MKAIEIAELCHEANRVYCASLGDRSQPMWQDASGWQQDSALHGVEFHRDNPGADASASHENWLKEKEVDGWVYGAVKDPAAKEHPCMVPYDELPAEQRFKDTLFLSLVRVLLEAP